MSHEAAILFESRSIVRDELEHPAGELSQAELHTVLSNARQDISGIAIILAGISERQRRTQWLLVTVVFLLCLIAYRL